MMTDISSWKELWDQQANLNEYTQKGIELIERMATYCKERSAIEHQYAANLKALAKKTQMKMKNENELWNAVTYVKSFHNVINGLNPIAVQHEAIGDNLKNQVYPLCGQKIGEYKSAKKQLEIENAALTKQLSTAENEMHKSNKEYGKSFKETEAALLKYVKAERNMELSRLELEKTKNNYTMKSGMLNESKQTYFTMTTKYNEEHADHYDRKLPQLLENYKQLHNNRILDTVDILSKCVEAEASVNSIIASCHNDMRHDISLIDPLRDASLVVENMKSGLPPPQPHVPNDLGRPESSLDRVGSGSLERIDATLKKGTITGRNKDGKGVARKQSMHQKFFGGGSSDKKNDSEYGTLPPQQRARKLQAKIDELDMEMKRAIQSQEGVQKIQKTYRDNPKLGNPSHCDAQLNQYEKEISDLNKQIADYAKILNEVRAQLGAVELSVGGSDTPTSNRSISSASSGVTSRTNTLNEAHHQSLNGGNGRRESFSGSGSSDHDAAVNGNGIRDELYEECSNPNPILGEAIAQFAFDGAQEGTIRMEANEKLWLIEKDEGDGWTRVRKENNSADGFVPSSYLKVNWFDGRC